jgi:hypothetical protein
MFGFGADKPYKVYRSCGFTKVLVDSFSTFDDACREADRHTGGEVRQNGRLVYER